MVWNCVWYRKHLVERRCPSEVFTWRRSPPSPSVHTCCHLVSLFVYTLFLRRRAVHGRYVQTLRHPQNEKYTGYIVRRDAARGGPSQVLQLAIGCMHRKLGEVRTCYFGDVRADTTNKQTHISHYSALIFHCTRTLVILCCDQFSLTYMQFQHSKLATRCPSLFESSWCFNNRLRPLYRSNCISWHAAPPPVNNRRILLEKKVLLPACSCWQHQGLQRIRIRRRGSLFAT